MDTGDDSLSLVELIDFCEQVVEDLVKDKLFDSNSSVRNDKLRDCIQKLQSLSEAVERLALFSTNDQLEEISTASLRFLLIPAYLGYLYQEIQVDLKKRKAYLNASKASYRDFLQNLRVYSVINFRLPWLDDEDKAPDSQGTSALRPSAFEEAVSRREQKINRLKQMEQLEATLGKLRHEQQRKEGDEAAQREIVLVLLRFWSMRAIKDLEMVEDELKMLDQFDAMTNAKNGDEHGQSSQNVQQRTLVPLKPFIIAKTEEQKRVFGLGYPSVPTVTVDEWFEQMQKSGGFGGKTTGQKRQMETITIGRNGDREGEEGKEEDEEKEEQRRQSQMQRDEWKDVNPRGWGNTYNKG